MLFHDRVEVGTREKLPNGFLKVDARFSRTGIQLYRAGELGVTDRPAHETIRVYRPPEEVFAPEAMASMVLLPVTNDHPPDDVTADNVRDLAVGWGGEVVTQDGDHTRGTIIIADAAQIRRLEDQGKDQLSLGYVCDLDWTAGTLADTGETYDAIQRTIRGNHHAIVDAGRCGPSCRISDKEGGKTNVKDAASCDCGEQPMADPALKKIMVDGIGMVSVNDEAEPVIARLSAELKTAKDALSTKDGEMAAKDVAHTAALAAKDKELEAAKGATLDAAALDARVAERSQLIVDAKLIGGDDLVTDGVADLDIRKAAVSAALGDEACKDKADTFYEGAFATLVAQAAKDAKDGAGGGGTPARGAPPGGGKDPLRDGALRPQRAEDKRDTYEDRMAKRWQGGNSKKEAA